MTANLVVHLTAANWDTEVTKATTPVLVDFWAEWCGPCKMIAPVLNELAGELSGKIKIAKVNVEESQNLAAKFQIRSIPTLLVFKAGVVQEQMVGAPRKADLQAKLNAYM
ncbi:MAG: thioredoxin [Kiritimatiellae bacterium]|nr:thioredoxin [Verrucomicrobiota bacterium]MBU4285756.1 thioredoxin [Verrucomicrobiota bacterium]MBU4366072.1 thioredoxin [Verrucomicrobiota bacterium]MCG2659464.1 thioredoxin [Kiritimatiellia bacterium]